MHVVLVCNAFNHFLLIAKDTFPSYGGLKAYFSLTVSCNPEKLFSEALMLFGGVIKRTEPKTVSVLPILLILASL